MDDRRTRPFARVLRRVECLAGTVEVAWSVAPRFGYGAVAPDVEPTADGAVLAGAGLVARAHALGLGAPVADRRRPARPARSWRPAIAACSRSRRRAGAARSAAATRSRPRLDDTVRWWRHWSGGHRLRGPVAGGGASHEPCARLLVSRGTGAVLAAGTTSLPEVEGGVRNWDYRYSWVRDSLLVLDAFFERRADQRGDRLLHVAARSHRSRAPGRSTSSTTCAAPAAPPSASSPLAGWRGSRPVRVGNGAAGQYQQSTYGTLLHACHLYATRAHGGLARRAASARSSVGSAPRRRLARPDAGIWEERGAPSPPHALEDDVGASACTAPPTSRGAPGIEHALARSPRARPPQAPRRSSRQRCVDPLTGAYARAAHGASLDAAVLMPLAHGLRALGGARAGRPHDRPDPRAARRRRDRCSTATAHDDGLPGDEGFFTPCSFWLASRARALRPHRGGGGRARRLTGLANDVGLYSEELGRTARSSATCRRRSRTRR